MAVYWLKHKLICSHLGPMQAIKDFYFAEPYSAKNHQLNSHNSRQIRVWMCEKLIKGNKKTRYRFFAPATAVNRTTKIQHPLLFNLQMRPNQILILIVPMKVETGQEARVRAGGTPWTPGYRLRWQPNIHDKFQHIYKLTLIARETLRTFIKFQRNKYFP